LPSQLKTSHRIGMKAANPSLKTFNLSPTPTGGALSHHPAKPLEQHYSTTRTTPTTRRSTTGNDWAIAHCHHFNHLKPLLHPIIETSALQDLHFRFREQLPSAAFSWEGWDGLQVCSFSLGGEGNKKKSDNSVF